MVAHSESLKSIRTELTIDLWAWFDLEKLRGTRGTLVTKTPDGGFGFGYMLEYADIAPKTQALGFYLAESWGKRDHHVFNNAIQTTGWHHIVATFSARTMKATIFIDGVKVFSKDSLINEIAPGTTDLTIGAIERNHNDRARVNTFLGSVDDVRIWSKALTTDDVQNYYGHMFVKNELLQPAHLATTSETRPTLIWTAAEDGTDTILQLSSTPGFTVRETLGGPIAENMYRPEVPLDAGVWYWRIFSTDEDGKPTSATKTRAFIVEDDDSELAFVHADTTPPVITGVRPFAFNTASDDRPTIKASWSDDQALDLSTARLRLDDEDITAKALISQQGLEFTPDKALSRGNHTVRIEIRDRAGNHANTVKHLFSTGAAFKTHVALQDSRLLVNNQPFFPIIYYH
ncbi:MAG: LamG domain-containing protein, partial [Dechloromonas sp.]|nr:LamG domain-containing protein [Dechloromonas sp.]